MNMLFLLGGICGIITTMIVSLICTIDDDK
jgi:hypothetical protein